MKIFHFNRSEISTCWVIHSTLFLSPNLLSQYLLRNVIPLTFSVSLERIESEHGSPSPSLTLSDLITATRLPNVASRRSNQACCVRF